MVENTIATSNAAAVTVRSAGNVVVPDDVTHRFWVDLYVDPSHKPGYSPPPLPVGADVYALVDSYGAVWESDEGNNLPPR